MIKKSKTRKFLDWWIGFTKYDRRVNLVDIDFEKSWLHVFWQQKYLSIITFAGVSLSAIASTIMPIWLGNIIDQRDFDMLVWFFASLVGMKVFDTIVYYFGPILRLQTANSVITSAMNFFLVTDPKHHTTRSSGQIISKINRASKGFAGVLGTIIFNLGPLVIQIMTFCLVLWNYDWSYGFWTILFMLTILVLNIYLFRLRSSTITKIVHDQEDKATQSMIENLAQVVYIRSLFATPIARDKMNQSYARYIIMEAAKWRIAGHIIGSIHILFFIYSGFLSYFLIGDNSLSVGVISAILFTLLAFVSKIQAIGKQIDDFVESIEGINNLYGFIRNFGQSSYPVFESKKD